MTSENVNAQAGGPGVHEANSSRQKELASNSQLESRKQAPRRNARVICPICERKVERKARQQVYCSPNCMRKANYARKAGCGLLSGQDTALVPNPPKILHDLNALQAAISRSSARIIGPRRVIDAELIAGREWQQVVSAGGVTYFVSRLSARALVSGGAP